MNTSEIAKRLVALCRKGDFTGAQNELFAENAVSIEPFPTPQFEKETRGLKAIREKGEKWDQMVEEMKNIDVSDPVVAENAFACSMRMQVVMKEHGAMDMSEICLYQVKDGKIVSEEFHM